MIMSEFPKDKTKFFDNFCFESGHTFKANESRYGKLSYVVVDNFFKDPDNVRDNLLTIPFDTGQQLLDGLMEKGEECKFMKPMGHNQLISSNLTQQWTWTIIEMMKDFNYIPMDDNKEKDVESISRMMNSVKYDGSLYYPNMTVNCNNVKCHPRQADFNFTIFLGDAEGDENGMSFYNMEYEDEVYWGITDILNNVEDPDLRLEFQDLLQYKYQPTTNIEKFSDWQGDNYYKKLINIPAVYNRLILFSGDTFSQQNYDNKSARYTIDGSINIPPEYRDNEGMLNTEGLDAMMQGAPVV